MKHTFYFVRIQGQRSSFAPEGYSQYNKRLTLSLNGELKRSHVYGPAQARAHVKELRARVYEGRKPYADQVFEIVKEVRTEQVIAKLKR
jgi:hypothetical protein